AAPAAVPAAGETAAPGPDEFASFLTDVTTTVGKAVEAWRGRIAAAVMRWQGGGYRTRRLEALLQRDTPVAPDDEITAFDHDVERLKALETEVAQFDEAAAGESVFRDPERLAEAEEVANRVRSGIAPPPGPSAAFPLAAFAAGSSNEIAVNAVRDI